MKVQQTLRLNFKEKKLISEEEVSQRDIEYAVKRAKQQLQSDILTTEQSLDEAKEALSIAKSTYPLNTLTIAEAYTTVQNLEKGLALLHSLEEELGFK